MKSKKACQDAWNEIDRHSHFVRASAEADVADSGRRRIPAESLKGFRLL